MGVSIRFVQGAGVFYLVQSGMVVLLKLPQRTLAPIRLVQGAGACYFMLLGGSVLSKLRLGASIRSTLGWARAWPPTL